MKFNSVKFLKINKLQFTGRTLISIRNTHDITPNFVEALSVNSGTSILI